MTNIIKQYSTLGGLFLLVWLIPSVSVAAEGEINGANTAWILTSTALVLFMTIPVLSLFYAGLVVDSVEGSIPETVWAAFQMTFAIITPALIVGAFVERIKFSSMLLFSVLWSIFVYCPVAHWVWSGEGWLYKIGLLDFAGGTVVHVTAGVAALITALVLGKRDGFPGTPMMPHNLTMCITGGAMLWVGWFGFNAGSALAADGSAGMALIATHMSAAAGAATWATIEWIKHGKPSGLGAVTGMVAGLATITPASGSVGPAGGLIIGIMGGFVCFFATNYLKQKLKVDDSLDVFLVHGVGGIVGTLMAAIFVSSSLGVFSGNGYSDGMAWASQLQIQVTGILAIGIYTAIMTFILLKIVGAITSGIRVSPDQEQVGLDISAHDEKGYNM